MRFLNKYKRIIKRLCFKVLWALYSPLFNEFFNKDYTQYGVFAPNVLASDGLKFVAIVRVLLIFM